MKSNFKDIFEACLDDLMVASDIDIEKVLDKMMPQIQFYNHPTKSRMARELIRQRLTSAMNNQEIYSFKKGHFVSIENASEEQLEYFKKKAERDIKAAEVRKQKSEMMLNQIAMAWDDNGVFIGYQISKELPKAVNE